MMKTKIALSKYFQGIVPFNNLGLEAAKSDYKWKLPETSFNEKPLDCNGTNFEATVKLKLMLHEEWKSNPNSRKDIANWIVSKWGGIKTNRKQTLDKYYLSSLETNPQTSLSGIASFSKILAIKDPFKYAIYDARVAVSLNAVQMISKVSSGEVFPYIAGRNNITGNWSSKPPRGFSKNKLTSVKTLVSAPHYWEKVPKETAYGRYLNLLGTLSKEFGVPLYHLEMALFSQAEVLACLVIPSLNSNS